MNPTQRFHIDISYVNRRFEEKRRIYKLTHKGDEVVVALKIMFRIGLDRFVAAFDGVKKI